MKFPDRPNSIKRCGVGCDKLCWDFEVSSVTSSIIQLESLTSSKCEVDFTFPCLFADRLCLERATSCTHIGRRCPPAPPHPPKKNSMPHPPLALRSARRSAPLRLVPLFCPVVCALPNLSPPVPDLGMSACIRRRGHREHSGLRACNCPSSARGTRGSCPSVMIGSHKYAATYRIL